MGTGKEQKITITANSGLSEEEIKKMMDDAQAHAEEDKKKKEAADTRNRADSLVYQTEKQLKENGDKIPENIKAPLESSIADLKKAIEANDTDRMNSIMKDMEEKLHAFAQELYKNAGPQAGAQQAGPQPGPESNPGNGDFIDVDEKK
jgi:molecular chaperone DnaK